MKPPKITIRKPLLIIRVKVTGEIYDRVYGIKDIQNVIDLFNDIHGSAMKIEIEESEVYIEQNNDILK